MPPLISKQTLLADIARVARQLGHPPRTAEYERLGHYSTITVRKSFGPWRQVLEAAGIQPEVYNRQSWSDSDIEREIDRLTHLLGHPPSYTEITRYSKISPDTFARRIGKSNFTDPRHPPVNPLWNLETISEADGAWISGLVTGEGSFIITYKGNVSFRVGLRADDSSILEYIKSIMDLPQAIVTFSNTKRRARGEKVGDEARLAVSNRWVIKLRVIPFFERFPLRGRKALDFAIFREAIDMLCLRDTKGHFRQRFSEQEKTRLTELTNKLKSLRVDPTAQISQPQI